MNDLKLFLFEFQSSLLLAAVSTVPILGVPFLLSAVITGSMKIHPREVVLPYNCYNIVEVKNTCRNYNKSAEG